MPKIHNPRLEESTLEELRRHDAGVPQEREVNQVCAPEICLSYHTPVYKINCRRPAKIEVAPMRAGNGGMTTASAELDFVGDDPLVDEGFVPWPPGLATAPEQVYLPLMMFLLFLSAWKPEQSNSADVCRLKAPTTWARAGSSTLR